MNEIEDVRAAVLRLESVRESGGPVLVRIEVRGEDGRVIELIDFRVSTAVPAVTASVA